MLFKEISLNLCIIILILFNYVLWMKQKCRSSINEWTMPKWWRWLVSRHVNPICLHMSRIKLGSVEISSTVLSYNLGLGSPLTSCPSYILAPLFEPSNHLSSSLSLTLCLAVPWIQTASPQVWSLSGIHFLKPALSPSDRFNIFNKTASHITLFHLY